MELTLLEQRVLLAIIELEPNAYGVTIQSLIKKECGREPSSGSVYAALDRLEQRKFVKSRQGEPTAARGGRRKLFFTITAPGKKALKESLAMVTARAARELGLQESAS
jgi:PadR family transcriptional regulator